MEKKLQGVPWSQKKAVMKEFLDFEKSKKAQANIDPKVMVKNDYRNGKLSSFAS